MARIATEQFAQGVLLPRNLYKQVIPSINSGFSLTLNRECCIGLLLGPQTIDRIGFAVTNTPDSGSVVRIGVRADADGSVGAPVVDVPVAAASSGWKEATVSYAHPGGVLWVTWTGQGWTTTAPGIDGGQIANGNAPEALVVGSAALTTMGWAAGHGPVVGFQSGVTGALPATFVSTAATNVPAITLVLRRAA